MARLALMPLVALVLSSTALSQSPCGTWSLRPVPFDPSWTRAKFEDVAALPDGTAWAVGSARRPTTTGSETITLAMRHDGQGWVNTPTPYVAAFPGGANDALHAVAALAPNEVWAAGERHGDAGGLSVGAWLHVLRWDGATWGEMPVPPPPGGAGINFSGPRVYDIAAFASNDIWFVGLWGEPNANASVTWRPLAMHWDGSGMTVAPTPALYSGTNPMHLRQVAAVAPDDIWGICRTNVATGVTGSPTVLHYDGTAWSQVATPSLGASVVLDDVVAIASDDVWIFGHTYFPSSPFALHWTGSSFTLLQSAPWCATAAALDGDEVYVGGGTMELFDGANWSTAFDFAGVPGAVALGSDALGSCTVWAVGREATAPNGELAPFAAVMSGGVGTLACAGAPNSTGVGASLAVGGSPQVSANNLTLTAASLPPQSFGFFLTSRTTALVANPGGSQGNLCLGSSIGRFVGPGQVQSAGALGRISLAVDLGALPQPSGFVAAAAGQSWSFQAWYRDANPGVTSNFSAARTVVLQ